jgi:choline dehydrogenase-like flavoprotein
MLIDAREVPEGTTIETDICIIGAGAAGITLAREFLDAPFRTCLLESGGLEYNAAVQDLYKGQNTGLKYYDLDVCRLRYFGGTTNHWGGECRPLSPIDFEAHSWVPNSGWPFGFDELEPYYQRAQKICQLGPYGYDAAYLRKHVGAELLPLSEDRMVTGVIQFSPPTRFGEVYRPEIKAAANVAVYLNANVTSIEAGNPPNAVTRLRIATLSGRKLGVTAKYYILSAGGIENARLLLVSNEAEAAGLGNGHDLVGRFFMDHPEGNVGLLLPINRSNSKSWSVYCEDCGGFLQNQHPPMGYFSPRKSVLEQEKFLQCSIGLTYVNPTSEGWSAIRRIWHGNSRGADQIASELWRALSDIEGVVSDEYGRLTRGLIPPKLFNLYCWGQAAPNPDSRITLGDDRDGLGTPRIKLDMQVSELDRYSMKRTVELFAQTLGESGLGRVKISFDDLQYGNHHMGTTRMSADVKRGVVNADCRVHGIENLYVAGSSVFPTSGTAHPTLTIVALALRLADHIKRSIHT